MSLTILYKGPESRGECWKNAVSYAFPQITWLTWPNVPSPEKVDAIITWTLPDDAFELFSNVKVIFSVGAGVDQLNPASFPSHVRLVRMIDPSIATQMISYVTSAVLMIHRNHFDYANAKQQRRWTPMPVALPSECTIGVMGLGNLGRQVSATLNQLGFNLRGWSRSPKSLANVTTFSGNDALGEFLSQCNILICLLPLTEDTKGLLNYTTLSQLPQGAALINVGRGDHLVERDLITMLNTQHIKHAVLDVVSQEPLPESHPFWQHPNIHITPHIASATREHSAAQQLVSNIDGWLNGKAINGEVSLHQGY